MAKDNKTPTAVFEKGTAERIVAATRYVEGLPRGGPGRGRTHYDQNARYLGKADSAIAAGASGTVRIYSGTTKGSESDTGVTITSVYNRFADVADEAWVHIAYIDGGWELTAAEC
jgi:hypothetical protein